MGSEDRLDLIELDAMTAGFDLAIASPEEVEEPSGPLPHEVTRSMEDARELAV